MPDRTSSNQAYFEDGLVYARFSDDRRAGRSVEFAGPPSRQVNGATGKKGPWEASWSWVTVVASYDENDDLHDIEIIGVPSRRPASEPKGSPEPAVSGARLVEPFRA
jgi:hypothetical protein